METNLIIHHKFYSNCYLAGAVTLWRYRGVAMVACGKHVSICGVNYPSLIAYCVGIAEIAGVDNAGLEKDGCTAWRTENYGLFTMTDWKMTDGDGSMENEWWPRKQLRYSDFLVTSSVLTQNCSIFRFTKIPDYCKNQNFVCRTSVVLRVLIMRASMWYGLQRLQAIRLISDFHAQRFLVLVFPFHLFLPCSRLSCFAHVKYCSSYRIVSHDRVKEMLR